MEFLPHHVYPDALKTTDIKGLSYVQMWPYKKDYSIPLLFWHYSAAPTIGLFPEMCQIYLFLFNQTSATNACPGSEEWSSERYWYFIYFNYCSPIDTKMFGLAANT